MMVHLPFKSPFQLRIMPCFEDPIPNCGGTLYVCLACAGRCRAAMLFQIICFKILSMWTENLIWTRVLVARFVEHSSSFFGPSPSTRKSDTNQNSKLQIKRHTLIIIMALFYVPRGVFLQNFSELGDIPGS